MVLPPYSLGRAYALPVFRFLVLVVFFGAGSGSCAIVCGSIAIIRDAIRTVGASSDLQPAGVVVVVVVAGVTLTEPHPGHTEVLGTTSLVRLCSWAIWPWMQDTVPFMVAL